MSKEKVARDVRSGVQAPLVGEQQIPRAAKVTLRAQAMLEAARGMTVS